MRPVSTMDELACVVRTERKAQGLTQTELADVCNVGLSYIVNLEHGKETAEIGKALRVLQMLGIDLLAKKRGE